MRLLRQSSLRWQQHSQVQLDHPVSEFRSALDAWVDSRREAPRISHYTEAPEHIDWPNLKPPPQDILDAFLPVSTTIEFDTPDDHPTFSDVDYSEDVSSLVWATDRKDRRERGLEFLDWQRPPQGKIPPGCYVLANGAVVSEGISN